MFRKLKNQKGFSIIEVLLALAMFSIVTVGILYMSIDTMHRDITISTNQEALLYAQEGLEVSRNIADKSFLSLANGDHGLQLDSGEWSFIVAPEAVDSFYDRTINVSDVYSDESGNIDEDSGTFFDPDVKKVIVEIEWLEGGVIPKSVELSSYVTDWKGDDLIRTTCTEWESGTHGSTQSFVIDGPPVDNCEIRLNELAVPSEFFSSANVGKHGNDVVIDGNYAYLAVNSTWNGLSIINISNPSSPSETSDEFVGGKGRYVFKKGDYIYMGVQSWLTGLAIVDVSNPNSADWEAGWFIGHYGNKPTVDDDNNLFIGSDWDWYSMLIYDVTNKSFPILTEIEDFNDDVHVIELYGDYAFVGIDDDSDALHIGDISNLSEVDKITSMDVGEEINSIVRQGTILYVGTEDSDDSLHIIDISNIESPSEITSLDVGGEIEDIAIDGEYLYAALNSTNSGLASVNISNPSAPSLTYNLDIEGKGTGIDTDGDYVYISTNTSNRGLVIIGTTEVSSVTSGDYISDIYNTGSASTRFNYIEWEHTEVPGGDIRFQLRTSSSEEGLESETWVGPDGTNSTYYETSRTPVVTSPGSGTQYVQFKADIDSDGVTSPAIQSVTINYTP
ncbi:prepilin-type N-terminal cleavage/methylation domain-containing protein [Candidatus Peregrinibacteria bacterium]|nr:prepilin-type N-terminal cleavage/methylation domain-containing protein [Candidatus Peregrinibacteria bacterium]MBT7736397.1 prepilin-type N-terminal cleavage/methylation domain-containing protein [Candidatus Peregrinibacteria bacterium]